LPSHAVMKEQMAFEWKMEIVVAADELHAVRFVSRSESVAWGVL